MAHPINSAPLNHWAENVELLLDALSTFKSQFEGGISEYELITQLQRPPYAFFDTQALRHSLTLFQTHFVLFHVLYRLRKQWRELGDGELEIHATRIVLKPFATVKHSGIEPAHSALAKDDSLARYYLNWNNLLGTDEADIESMLNSFWQRMVKRDWNGDSNEIIAQSHSLLDLPVDTSVTRSVLKIHYRRQLSKVHPDKGGSQKAAQNVISAYQCLIRYYGLT